MVLQNLVEFPGLGLSFNLIDGFMIGSFKIHFYGVIIAVGVILAMIYVFANFRKVGVDPDRAIDCIIGGFIGGYIGARVYYVAFSWDTYKDDLMSIFDLRSGGLAIYGGIIGGLLVGVLIAKWRKVKIMPLLDVAGIGFLIGQGVGRWGNFFNVEAFGSNTTLPWGMTSPSIVNYLSYKQAELSAIGITVDPNVPVHPCFLYESLWCALGVLLLALYLKHRKFDGEVFLMYLGYYGLGRGIIEGLRTDSLMIGTLRVSQVLAFLLFLACTLIIIVIRLRIKGNHDENYLKLYALTPEGQAIVNNEKPVEASYDEAIPDEPEEVVEEDTEETADTADVIGEETEDERKDN